MYLTGNGPPVDRCLRRDIAASSATSGRPGSTSARYRAVVAPTATASRQPSAPRPASSEPGRETRALEISGPGGQPIAITPALGKIPDDELQAEIAMLEAAVGGEEPA